MNLNFEYNKYHILALIPGVAHDQKNLILKKNVKKKFILKKKILLFKNLIIFYMFPRDTRRLPQKM